MAIPTEFQTATPYLILNNCVKFIQMMQTLFQAAITEQHLREEDNTKIMHAELKIGNAVIMCADSNEMWNAQPAGIFIYVHNADVSYQKALDLGCTTIMNLCDQHYGRTCGVQDEFGNTWWITSV